MFRRICIFIYAVYQTLSEKQKPSGSCLNETLEKNKTRKSRDNQAHQYDSYTSLFFLLCLAEGYFDMIDVFKLKSIFYISVTEIPFICLSLYNIYLQLGFRKYLLKMVFSLICKSSSGIDQMFKSRIKSPERLFVGDGVL